MTEGARLIGIADPSGQGLGFLIPVFSQRPANELVVQVLDANGRVAGFEGFEAQEAPLAPVKEMIVAEGEAPVWVFALGPDDVLVGQGDDGREALERRLDDPFLLKHPLLATEAAEFLGSPRHFEFAHRAFEQLRAATPKGALRWRDLCVLTPLVRQILRSNEPARRADPSFSGLVATFADEDVTLHGTPAVLSDGDRETLMEAALEALRRLSAVFPDLAHMRAVHMQARGAQPSRVDAIVHVVDPMLSPLVVELRRWSAPAIRVIPPTAKRQPHVDPDLPHFLVGRARDHDELDFSDAPANSIKLQLTGNAELQRFIFAARAEPPVVFIPLQGFNQRSGDLQRESAALQHALVALLAAPAELRSILPEAVFLRTRGQGPDPQFDAFLALYDRAWSLELIPALALRFAQGVLRRAREPMERREDLDELLFSRGEPLRDFMVDRVFAASRTDAALLVPVHRRDSEDWQRHRNAIAELFMAQSWSLDDLEPGRAGGDFEVRGARAKWRVSVPSSPKSPDGPRWDPLALLGQPLASLERIEVSCEASPAKVLSRMRDGVLSVNMRDLGRLSADRATPYTLLAAQLARMVGALPSRARSHFLGVLVHDALQRGAAEVDSPDALMDAVSGEALGEQTHFTARRIRVGGDRVTAEVRLVAAPTNEFAKAGDMLVAPFELEVGHEGIRMLPLSGIRR